MTLFFNYRNGTIYILVLLFNKLYIIIFYSSNSSNSNSNSNNNNNNNNNKTIMHAS